MSELNDLEYSPIHVRGRFLHDKELYMGPRSLLKDGDAASAGGLISKGQNANIGYLVVTPFELADRGYLLKQISIENRHFGRPSFPIS